MRHDFTEDLELATNAKLWTISDMLPKIIVTNADLDVHGMAQYFEQMHHEESVDVVKFLFKFVPGTLVRDLRKLTGRWVELPRLDVERAIARKANNVKEDSRILAEFTLIGVTPRDFSDPKTGEVTTAWEVAR